MESEKPLAVCPSAFCSLSPLPIPYNRIVDTITHGIAGALVAKSFVPERESRLATLALTFGAVFPDSDGFAQFFASSRLAWLETHRGVTHSFLMLPVWALLFGGLVSPWTGRRRWLLFSGLCGLGIALHISLDLITSYGTMILSPWRRDRFALDITFILDLILTAIVLLPQLLAWVYSHRDQAAHRGLIAWFSVSLMGAGAAWLAAAVQLPLSAWAVIVALAMIALLFWAPSLGGWGFRWSRAGYCRVGVAALAVYLILCGIAHRAALTRVEAFVRSTGATAERLAALPAPPSLNWWSGLAETPEGIYRLSIHLTDPTPPAYRFFPNPGPNSYVEKSKSLTDVQTFLWFARFPWVTYRQENGFHVLEYTDLQFYGPPRGRANPFTFRVAIDNQGRVVSSGMLQP